MPQTHETRRSRVRRHLAGSGADAVLVTRLVNVRYLTGFTGSNGALLVTPDAAVLATDGRYRTQSAEQAPDVEHLIERAVGPALAARAARAGVRRLAFESHDVTVDGHRALLDAAEGCVLEPLGHVVEELRSVKDADEIAALRAACAAADAAFAELLGQLRPGRSERDVAAEIESRMRAHGADGTSFETIVAGGPHSAVPHHRPTNRVLGAGELLKVDFGALVAGYHSDMTRTVVLGPVADWQRDVYELVAHAQRAGVEAVAAGVETGNVDRASRSVIEEAGHGEHFVHGLGHGVGLEIHEAPALGHGITARLVADMVVTVEPGVYLPGRGGVRIEDTLVVPRDAGDPEVLTTSTKELLVL